MPTYDYRCATCGGRFETFQSITADALATCTLELCQSENPEEQGHGEVRRIVSGGAGVVFKGQGFYLTDYARKGKGKGDREDLPAKSDSSDSSTGSGKSGEASNDSGSGKDAGGKGSADTSSD
jgi:putative FmdB family regulatory protein